MEDILLVPDTERAYTLATVRWYRSWRAGAPHHLSWCARLRNSTSKPVIRDLEKLWSPSRKSETILALGRKHMAHNHGSEYQVKIVHEDGTEELSGWMTSEEQVPQAMAAGHRPQGKAYWLRERNVLCPNCLDTEQRIVEYPLTDIPSPRCSPHDSRYLLSVGSMDRYALAFPASWHTP